VFRPPAYSCLAFPIYSEVNIELERCNGTSVIQQKELDHYIIVLSSWMFLSFMSGTATRQSLFIVKHSNCIIKFVIIEQVSRLATL
jgi:hypothetical protein